MIVERWLKSVDWYTAPEQQLVLAFTTRYIETQSRQTIYLVRRHYLWPHLQQSKLDIPKEIILSLPETSTDVVPTPNWMDLAHRVTQSNTVQQYTVDRRGVFHVILATTDDWKWYRLKSDVSNIVALAILCLSVSNDWNLCENG